MKLDLHSITRVLHVVFRDIHSFNSTLGKYRIIFGDSLNNIIINKTSEQGQRTECGN